MQNTQTMKLSILMFLAAAARIAVAEPAAGDPDNFAAALAGKTVFDEKFEDNPIKRFQFLPAPAPESGGSECKLSYDEKGHSYAVEGHASLVRAVQAGSRVALDLSLEFAPPGKQPAAGMKTGFFFVLGNRSTTGIEFVRSEKTGRPAIVRFVQSRPGQSVPGVLREITLKDTDTAGDWQLGFNCGLLTLRNGATFISGAYPGDPHGQIIGISWNQQGGRTVCRHMALTGDPFPKFGAEEFDQLKTAILLNQEAQRLLGAKKTGEALVKMKESSALFVKVYGENHSEAANSFSNLGAILKAAGKADESREFLAKALLIHEISLGATHPHTTLSRFNLGDNYMRSGDRKKAKEIWTRCLEDWTTVLGPDYPMAKTLEALLPKL
jgi:tetratricopeptide (TPR) repeat protein